MIASIRISLCLFRTSMARLKMLMSNGGDHYVMSLLWSLKKSVVDLYNFHDSPDDQERMTHYFFLFLRSFLSSWSINGSLFSLHSCKVLTSNADDLRVHDELCVVAETVTGRFVQRPRQPGRQLWHEEPAFLHEHLPHHPTLLHLYVYV